MSTDECVSDSEVELTPFKETELATIRLKSAIRQRIRRNDSFGIKSTNLVDADIKALISAAIEKELKEMNDENEFDISIAVDHENVMLQPANSTYNESEAESLQTLRKESTRGSRRRNISFYQQHIYTIDSVSYILRISLEQATDLVKKNPELIEKYHNGSLKRFLEGNEKSSSKTKKKQEVKNTLRTEKDAIPLSADLELSQNFKPQIDPSESEVYTDSSEDSSSSSSSIDSDEDSNSQTSNTHSITFRGRTYKNIDELSKVSKLPRSFFSIQNTKNVIQGKQKKNKVIEERVGLAKKKKSTALRQNNVEIEDTFVTEGDSLGNDDFLVDEPIESNLNTDDDQQILEVEETKGDNDDLFMLNNENRSSQRFYSTFDFNAQLKNDFEDDTDDIVEDSSANVTHMLASGRKERLTNRSSEMPKLSKKFQFTRRPSKSKHGESRVRKFKRNSSNSTKATKSKRKGSALQPKLNYLERYRTKQILDSSHKFVDIEEDEENEIDDEKNIKKPTKSVQKKKSKAQHAGYYFLAPTPDVIIPRKAHASTVIYEGLSSKFAIVKHPIKASHITPEYNTQAGAYPINDSPLTFRSQFINSRAFETLFKDVSIVSGEYIITIGKKNIVFSNLASNLSDKFKDFFIALLEPSTIRTINAESLLMNIFQVIEFTTTLDVVEAKSLVVMVENFKFQLESSIRKRGQIRDMEFLYLSLSYMLLSSCQKILQDNFLKLFDFRVKAAEICSLFFEFVSYIDGSLLRRKMKDEIVFAEAVSMLFLTEHDITWKSIRTSNLNDMEFFKDLCIRFQPKDTQWDTVRKIFVYHLDNHLLENLKKDVAAMGSLVDLLSWEIDEKTLLLLYEFLKREKFQNLEGESNHPVIFTENGINKDTSLNIYLNLLISFGKSHTKLSGRFLERVIPVSKSSSLQLTTLCNRLNMILCLSMASKRNLEVRFASLVTENEFASKISIERVLRAASVLVRVNNNNKLESKLSFLPHILDSVIKRKEYQSWQSFLESFNFSFLITKTQFNFIRVISDCKFNTYIIKSCSTVIQKFVSSLNDKESLLRIKDLFGDLNSSMFPQLWCYISGELVKHDLENWSRLIHFNNFDDEAYIYTYILRHGGRKVYELERGIFITSLIKNIVKRKFSSSLNSFIREIEKVDYKLLNSKSSLIQTNRLQITLNIISSLLKTDSVGAKSKYLSLLLNFMKLETSLLKKSSDNDLSYLSFAKKVVEFINVYGFDYVYSSKAFEALCFEFHITKRKSSTESSQLVNLTNNIQDSLMFVEEKLIKSLHNHIDFTKEFVQILVNYTSKNFGSPEQLSDSKFYVICCLTSVHIEILDFFPSTWIVLNELLKCFDRILKTERNFAQVDFYCILRTVGLFPYMLKNRNTRYLDFENLAMRNVYRILTSLYHLLDGTNDISLFIELNMMFLSRNTLYDNYVCQTEPKYIIKAPEFVKDMIVRANLTGDKMISHSSKQIKEMMEIEFNNFVCLIENYDNDEDEETFLI